MNEQQVEQAKQDVATKAVEYVDEGQVVGVGSGSTVKYFIAALASKKHLLDGAVASSLETKALLKEQGIPVLDANAVASIDLYVDGADEATKHFDLIKGGGAALTGEKILRAMSRKFICIIDDSKLVSRLGGFPLPIEVVPLARSYVARELVKLGGNPEYREGVTTDYGNIILDVHNLTLVQPAVIEEQLNQISGVVTNGLFAKRGADVLLVGNGSNGVEVMRNNAST